MSDAHDNSGPNSGPGAGRGGTAGSTGPGATEGVGGQGHGARRGYGGGDYGGASYGGGSYGNTSYGGGSRLFDDLARFVTDAAGATQGVRREVETAMRAQAEAVLGRLDVVRRDEFEAMAEVARRARAEADTLRERVEALEARFGVATESDQQKN